MTADSGRDGERTDRDGSASGESPGTGSAGAEPSDAESPDAQLGSRKSPQSEADWGPTDDSGEPSGEVHVRRLGVGDTLRWSWATLRDHPELVGVALAANLPSVAAAVGVTRPTPAAELDVAPWVWPAYLVQLIGLTVVTGVMYLTAADAVAFRSRPLSARGRAAVRRVPSLVAAGIAFAVAVGASLLPTYLLDGGSLITVGVSLLAVLLAAYVFHRLVLALPAAVVDATGPLASLRAGWAAATGIVGKVFAVGVAYVVAAFASTVVSGLFGGEYDVASTFASAVTGAVVLPLFGLALAHLYLEGSRNR